MSNLVGCGHQTWLLRCVGTFPGQSFVVHSLSPDSSDNHQISGLELSFEALVNGLWNLGCTYRVVVADGCAGGAGGSVIRISLSLSYL